MDRNTRQGILGIPYKWQALMAVAVGTFMSTLDSNIVNVSLPTLSRVFSVDLTIVGWVVMAYQLTVTGLLLTFGRVADMVGRKRVYNVGFVVFTVGSLLCALSRSIGGLIASRVLQGIGAAMLASNGAAILTDAFPRSERGQALGLNGTIVSSGLMVGPPLGGFLIGAFGWRSVFTINLPIGVVGTLLGYYLLRPDPPRTEGERFDGVGAFLLLVGLASLLLALSRGQAWGWGMPRTVGLLGGATVGLLLFVWVEMRVAYPMMDLRLFRHRLFAAGTLSALISYMAVATATLLMPFYLHAIRGFSTAQTGLILAISPMTMLLVAPFSGWLSDRIGSRILSTLGIGTIALALALLSRLSLTASAADVASRLFLVGAGNGLFASPNSSAIMGAVPLQRLGIASGMISTVRTTGMVTGMAIAGAVVASQRAQLLAAGADPSLAFWRAITTAFLVASAIALAGVVPSLVRGAEERRAK